MGLDISAYSDLELLDAVYNQEHEPIDPVTRLPIPGKVCELFANPSFPARFDELVEGVYRYKDYLGFRAGSYGSYGQWRETLAQISGWPALDEAESPFRCSESAWEASAGPFWELINFSDCEGVIGPKTSAKLLDDFKKFRTQAEQHGDEWFLRLYDAWQSAFALAALNGAVDFH